MISRLSPWLVAAATLVLDMGCSGSDANGDQAECGNGIVEGIEECDDGNDSSGDGCGGCFVESGWSCDGEACDPVCGDRELVAAETCDPTVTPGYCSADCSEIIGSCGDGAVQAEAESCDPSSGNIRGCASCRPAFGFECEPETNTCVASGIPGETVAGDMSPENRQLYCGWLLDLLGGTGESFQCGGTIFTVNSVDACTRELDFGVLSPCTMEELEDYVSSLGTRCTVMTTQSLPACAT